MDFKLKEIRVKGQGLTGCSRKKQYANMLLDINGKMVRSVFLLGVCVCVFMCSVCDSDSHTLICCLQVSATEECVGPMRLTQEPIQVRIIMQSCYFCMFEGHFVQMQDAA